jgi:hypothetical protein
MNGDTLRHTRLGPSVPRCRNRQWSAANKSLLRYPLWRSNQYVQRYSGPEASDNTGLFAYRPPLTAPDQDENS